MSQSTSIFDREGYSLMEDMTGQPEECEQCGAPYRREAAFLVCTKHPDKHSRYCEPVGRPEHPKNPEWEAYLDVNGRDAFTRAVERHIKHRGRF